MFSGLVYFFIFVPYFVSGNRDHYVTLQGQNKTEQEAIRVSGIIDNYSHDDDTIVVRLNVETPNDAVNIVYCDSYSDAAVSGQTTRDSSDNHVYGFTVTLPANAAVLNTVLGSAGLCCSVYSNQFLYHFSVFYGPNGGVHTRIKNQEGYLEILKNIFYTAPHLVGLVVTSVLLALVILIVTPTLVLVQNRVYSH